MNKRLVFSKRFCILFAIVITSCLLTSCSLTAEGETPSKHIDKTSIGPAVILADQLFAERADIEKLKQSVDLLATTRDPAERSYDVEWKFAKYSYFLGKATENENEAIKIFEAGKIAGQIGSRIHPDRPDGYFWYAANLGELSRISPVTVGIKSIDDIRDAMMKVVEIDPSYQSASAYDALGQLELETRNVKGGTVEKAVEFLETGFALNKDNANIRVHLAEAYIAADRDADARKMLSELLELKADPEYKIEHGQALEKANIRSRPTLKTGHIPEQIISGSDSSTIETLTFEFNSKESVHGLAVLFERLTIRSNYATSPFSRIIRPLNERSSRYYQAQPAAI